MTETIKQVGAYEVHREIGRGGMGVVYLARDTKLDRDVAIKVLPDEVAQDQERLARFEREAKLLGSLRHANIAAVYGLEEVDERRYLVLEYIDGEDLAARLERGPLPIDEALAVAREIAEAVGAAHEQGIIHRDLKPANVKITEKGDVKVLDFGLAKALGDQPSSMVSDLSASPTVVTLGSPTMPGVILGTAGYMSPEQARGRAADKRSDIWSFGCILYELLVGRQIFPGETVTDSLGAILHKDPEWSLLPSGVPPTVLLLLRRCLARDRKRRLQDIGDARIELEEAIADPTSSSLSLAGAALSAETRRPRRWWPVAGALLAVGALVGGGAMWVLHPKGPEPPLRKFEIEIENIEPNGGVAISPDGRKIVYSAGGQLWVRELERFEPRALAGTENAAIPFWSPDSTTIAYQTSGKLWKVPATGGEPTAIASVTEAFSNVGGGAWGPDDEIVFTTGSSGLFEVSAQGGDPVLVLDPDPETEDDYHDASALPGGRGVLFVVHRDGGVGDTIALLAGATKKILLCLEGERLYSPVHSPTGHILYHRQTTTPGIWALPFSLSLLEVTGKPFLVVPDGMRPSVSSDGSLVCIRGANLTAAQLIWVDRGGDAGDIIGQPQNGLYYPSISPDGRRVVVSAAEGESRDIWIHDVVRGTKTRLTFTKGNEWFNAWSASGDEVLFLDERSGKFFTVAKAADGTGEDRELVEGAPHDCSRDGRFLVYGRRGEETKGDIWYLPLQDGSEPVALVQTPANETRGRLAPDGAVIAYLSDESVRDEIYLKRFPSGGGKWQVTLDGGSWPRWSHAGDELFFVNENSLWVVPVETEPAITLGSPRELFSGSKMGVALFLGYDVAPDDERFVVIQNQSGEMGRGGITVVQNWLAQFDRAR
ncbi:MAG: protein kinase domain-containing protein [Planctomycetota bacterium]|jgi:Tol biopolymer transport system component/predicted Ser/Thr protein kinase